MRASLTIVALFAFSSVLSAQAVRTIRGEAIYNAPTNVTLDEAKKTVVQRAKTQALADAFGTMVNTQTMTSVVNSNASSSVDMTSLSLSEVKGEWLGDVSEPKISVIDFNVDGFVLKAEVTGKAREIKASKVDFEAKVLKNGTALNFASEEFSDGDELFVCFRTPVAGHLAIYLMDPDAGETYCLLPYREDESGLYKVSNKKEYIFFSRENAEKAEARIVDQYTLTTEKPVSVNHLFVIFSPNEFSKALDNTSADALHVIGNEEFNKWLTKSRTRDPKMQVSEISIQVKK